MKKYVILTSSILLVLIGLLIEDRGLAMGVAGGETFYPISSGSVDGLILKLGLYSFFITILFSVILIFVDFGDVILFLVYSVNSLIYAFCLFLVMLDSSIIDAAKLGDRLPLVANIICILSFAIYGALSLNKKIQRME
jgi:uncharacterized membrane protein